MAQILVRHLSPDVLALLKQRASRNGRSLEAELRVVLERAARQDVVAAAARAADIRASLAGRTHTDSAVLVREDRDR
jgi:plasmid stability protein